MKKGWITGIACLALVCSVAGCDNYHYDDGGVRTLNEVLDYDDAAGLFLLEGEEVTIKNVVVNGQHGNFLTVASLDTVTTVEVVQAEINPDVTVRKTVDVTGTVETYHGHCRIVDAKVTVVDDERLAVYVTTGMTRQSGFDSYGRTYSGVLATDVPLRVLSYNGTTELKEGVDTTITVAYQGEDYDDPWYWLDLIIWGDTDQETRDYLNAFLFGNNTGSVVTWDDPFKYEASHCEVAADWEGVKEGMYLKGLFHFYYDDVLNTDFGTMFYLDNICMPSLEAFELYDEETAVTTLLTNITEAFNAGTNDSACYTEHLVYENYQGDEIANTETTGWVTSGDNLSPEFVDYMESFALADRDEVYIRVSVDRWEMLIVQEEDSDYDFVINVFQNRIDEEEEGESEEYCEFIGFNSYEAYEQYLTDFTREDYLTSDDVEFDETYSGTWYDYYPALYDIVNYGDSSFVRGFHDNGEATRDVDGNTIEGHEYLINDINLSDALWDALCSIRFYDAEYWSESNLAFSDAFLSTDSNFMQVHYERSPGWYYSTTAGDSVVWYSTFDWTADITFGTTTLGNPVVENA